MDIPQYCRICGAQKQWKEGGTRKDGTTWEGFMACPNFKSHPPQPAVGGYRSAYTPKPQGQAPQAPTGANNETLDALRIIFKEIKDLRKEFAEFAQVFGDKQNDVKDI